MADMLQTVRKSFGKHADIGFVLGILFILTVLFAPIPWQLLDLLIIINITFALIVLLMTFYVEKPLQFSTFPAILLIATLFRLSLNIASTRLILADSHAGEVINAVGDVVVSGNYVIGLIVFVVLIVVQYVVVTNGAQRVAEVAARFTLDSMPGKQMAIDADMNMGVIDEKEAQARRKEIEKESSFYGAMDGASKFVKGDAIAGIIIVLINIIGGLAIGIAQLDMSWGTALNNYTLLTIGDGIVTQIPALVISTATGIIVTRASSDALLSKELGDQVSQHPKIFFVVGCVLLALLFMPGVPAWPPLLMACVMFSAGYFSWRKKASSSPTQEGELVDEAGDEGEFSWLDVHDVSLHFPPDMFTVMNKARSVQLKRVAALREKLGRRYGVILPDLKIVEDQTVDTHGYQVQIQGVVQAKGSLHLGKVLAIDPLQRQDIAMGVQTKDPTYGLPAYWLEEEQISEAKRLNLKVVEAQSVLNTHLADVLEKNLAKLFTLSGLEKLLARAEKKSGSLVQDVVDKKISKSVLLQILKSLVEQRVSIIQLENILEVINRFEQVTPENIPLVVEQIRSELAPQIVQHLSSLEGVLKVKLFAPELEYKFANQVESGRAQLPGQDAESVIKQLTAYCSECDAQDLPAVLVTAPEIRAVVWSYLSRFVPNLNVISMSEINSEVNIESAGLISI